MKIKLLLGLLMAIGALHAADDKEKGLPPGLQKKDKLPPGIAKKRGAGEERTTTVTNTVTVTNVVTAPGGKVPPTTTTPAPTGKVPPATPVKVDLDQRAKVINALDNKDAARHAALSAIAKETGVTVSTLQAQRREHEGMGTAGLLMANAIASKTKKPAGNYLRQRAEGKSWERIAADSGVSIAELDMKLARVEEAMRGAK